MVYLSTLLYVASWAIALYYLFRYIWELIPVGNLRNRAVFITGCDSGFGRLLAIKCSKNGIPVFAGCYTKEGQQSIESETKIYSGKLIAVPLDVTNDESVAKAAKFVKENLQLGHKLWALVNNAGAFSIYGPDAWCTIDEYKQAFEVNCLGMIRCTHAFLNLLKESQGRVISVSSVAGRVSVPVGAPYAVAKYGVEAYMDAIRQELRPFGIKCSILEPGIFKTPLICREAMIRRVNTVWSNISAELREEYGEEYKEDFVLGWNEAMHGMASSHLEYVVDNYYHAIISQFPRARYRCGWDSLLFYIPLTYMPTEVQDFIMKKLAGKHALPAVLEKKLKLK